MDRLKELESEKNEVIIMAQELEQSIRSSQHSNYLASVPVTPIRNRPRLAIDTELERFPASEPVSAFKVNPQSGCLGDE